MDAKRTAESQALHEVLQQILREISARNAESNHAMGSNLSVEHSEKSDSFLADNSAPSAPESADNVRENEPPLTDIVREKSADKTAVSEDEKTGFDQRTKNASPSGVFGNQNPLNPEDPDNSGQIPLKNGSNTPEIVRERPADKPAVSDLEKTANTPAEFDDDFTADDAIENDVYRIELQFFTDEKTRETSLKMRLRSRFTVDGSRPSFMLGTYPCGYLTKAQIEKARAKTLPPKVRAALTEGELEYELINRLLGRPGKGRSAAGRRAAEQNRVAPNAAVNPDKGSGERGQAGSGDDHQDSGFLDSGISADGAVTISDRIQ